MRILVVGANGYVGGRLVPELLAAGHKVALATRQLEPVAHRFPGRAVVSSAGDDPEPLEETVRGADAIASIPERLARPGDAAWDEDLELARTLGRAVAAANAADGRARRIVHLSDLGDDARGPASHGAASATMLAMGAPVLEIRAAPVLGAGSLSFDLLRHLAGRAPALLLSPWMTVPAQPVSIRDVLDALVAGLTRDLGGVIELGGPEVLTVADMLRRYRAIAGVHRPAFGVPHRGPVADRVTSLLSPLPVGVARELRERFEAGTTVSDPAPAAALGISRTPFDDEIRIALGKTQENKVETTWHDSLGKRSSLVGRDVVGADPGLIPPTPDVLLPDRRWLVDQRTCEVAAPPEFAFAQVERLGGEAGWPVGNFFWHVRGVMDRMVGGVGMRLGRRDRDHVRVGDAVDFWRVEAVERPRLLRLRAEMRVPGLAWLQYEAVPTPGGARLVQTAYFDPHGFWGYAYWYCLLPVHVPIFILTVRVLARRAERAAARAVTA